ncbi:MAG: HlyC/CorC family transporter, partial [Desulfobacteraceae bacterium]|nr:HlyC/CorC family transporter [Desulfobacteraceae bacterium]
IFKPFIWTLDRISESDADADWHCACMVKHESHSPDELRLLMKQSKDSGAIKEDNYEIIKNAFDFTDHIAKHIMVPRPQVFALELSAAPQEIIASVIENGYSRIPVYQESLDNVSGVVFAKDIFKAYVQNKNFNLKDLLRPAHYVFHNRKINTVLREFQSKHIHIAIVLDEYGGTDGIISLEDILEELVGEIQDEDDDEKPIVEQINADTYNVYATALLEDINTYLPRPLSETPKYTTLSGLIIYNCNRIPKIHEKLTTEDYEITILKRQRNGIMMAQLKDLKMPEQVPDVVSV